MKKGLTGVEEGHGDAGPLGECFYVGGGHFGLRLRRVKVGKMVEDINW